ncbi:hypothetical protein JCM16303_004365 [Sporobolomyces ruberrimus]
MFAFLPTWFKCHKSSPSPSPVIEGGQEPIPDSPPTTSTPPSYSSEASTSPVIDEKKSSVVEEKENVEEEKNEGWWVRCGRGIKKRFSCPGEGKCPCKHGKKKVKVEGGNEKTTTEEEVVVSPAVVDEDPFVDTTPQEQVIVVEESTIVPESSGLEGGAELTRTEMRTSAVAIEPPVVVVVGKKKGRSLFEKCKGMVQNGEGKVAK